MDATVTTKRVVSRSGFEQDTVCNVLWMGSMMAIFLLHIEPNPHLPEGFSLLAFNAAVIAAVPIIGVGVVKLVQPLGLRFMRRSKKIEFVDDVKGPRDAEEIPGDVANSSHDSRRTFTIVGKKGHLSLMLLCYLIVVLSSFVYQSGIYFFVAAILTAGIVGSFVMFFLLRKPSVSKDRGQDQKEIRELTPSLEAKDGDSFLTWVPHQALGFQFKLSRSWIQMRVVYLGFWIPLFLVIPLVGQLFSNLFWIGLIVGIVYVCLLEVCSILTLQKAYERFFPDPGIQG